MMKMHAKVVLYIAIVVGFASNSALAGMLKIQISGVNLSYNNSAIYDAGSNAGNNLNPAEADQLVTVSFLDENDNLLAPIMTSNIALDLFIPDVTGISSAPNTSFETDTPGNPGFFDLLFGSSPLASEYLALDLASVNVRYFDVSNFFQFNFGAAIADIGSQNLPFNLAIGDPVAVSFSAQVDSKTDSGGFITSFLASGTGEIRGRLVPEPTAVVLFLLGLLAVPQMARFRG